MLGDVDEPLLDRPRLGPDAFPDQLLELVAEMHERGEALAEPHGIEEGEPRLRRRDRCEDARHERLHRGERLRPRLRRGLDHQAAARGKADRRRNGDRGGHLHTHVGVGGKPLGNRLRVRRRQRHRPEAHPRRARRGERRIGGHRAPRGVERAVVRLGEAQQVAALGRLRHPRALGVAAQAVLLRVHAAPLACVAIEFGAFGRIHRLARQQRVAVERRLGVGSAHIARDRRRVDRGAALLMQPLRAPRQRLGQFGDRSIEVRVRLRLLGRLALAQTLQRLAAAPRALGLRARPRVLECRQFGLDRRPRPAQHPLGAHAQQHDHHQHEGEGAAGVPGRHVEPRPFVEQRGHRTDHAGADHDRATDRERRDPRQ